MLSDAAWIVLHYFRPMILLNLAVVLAMTDPGRPYNKMLPECYNMSSDQCCRTIQADYIIYILQSNFHLHPGFIYSVLPARLAQATIIKFWCYDSKGWIDGPEILGPYFLACNPYSSARGEVTFSRSPTGRENIRCKIRPKYRRWLKYLHKHENGCLTADTQAEDVKMYDWINEDLKKVLKGWVEAVDTHPDTWPKVDIDFESDAEVDPEYSDRANGDRNYNDDSYDDSVPASAAEPVPFSFGVAGPYPKKQKNAALFIKGPANGKYSACAWAGGQAVNIHIEYKPLLEDTDED